MRVSIDNRESLTIDAPEAPRQGQDLEALLDATSRTLFRLLQENRKLKRILKNLLRDRGMLSTPSMTPSGPPAGRSIREDTRMPGAQSLDRSEPIDVNPPPASSSGSTSTEVPIEVAPTGLGSIRHPTPEEVDKAWTGGDFGDLDADLGLD